MRNRMFLLITLVGLATPAFAKQIFVSLVEKNSVSTFYNRLATEAYHLVVTAKAPARSIETQEVTASDKDDLYIVELRDAFAATLPGEILRIRQFAIAKFWKMPGISHLHLGAVKNHVEKLGEELQSVPATLDESALEFSDGDGSDGDTLVPFSGKIAIDTAKLKKNLEEFSGARTTVINGSTTTIKERGSIKGRTQALAWLEAKYKALGYKISYHTYGRFGLKGKNFIAEKAGKDTSKYYIVSAHLDSVSNPGADDDGAGTISALAIAEALSKMKLKYSIRFLGFDQEELGLIGSTAYVNDLQKSGDLKKLAGVFNIEMTGYDSNKDGAYHVIDCNENTSAKLSKLVTDAIVKHKLKLKKIKACTNRSDHAPFWRRNKPAIVVSQHFFGSPADSNPCYHRSCDKTDRLNFDYMTTLTEALAYAVVGAVTQ